MFTYVYNQCSHTYTINVHIRIQPMFTYVYNQYLPEFAWSSSNSFENKPGLRTRSNFIRVQVRVRVQPILASPSSSLSFLI